MAGGHAGGGQDFHAGLEGSSNRRMKTWINVLLGLFQLLLPCQLQHGTAQLQVLSHISSGVVEVWQPEDTDTLVPVQVEEDRRKDGLPLEDRSSPYARENGRPLHFQPPMLDFGTQPVGVARAETIFIHNPSQEEAVTLLSMFTSSTHFHLPAFHRRVIPPRGKASFKLIFLPSEEGQVENSLFINTSAHGVMAYQVFGIGHRGSLKSVHRKDNVLIFPHIHSIKLTQTQEDASNITILGLVLECSLPKTLFSSPQASCLQTEEQQLSLQINLSERGEINQSERGEHPSHLDKLKPYVLEHILLLLAVPSAAAPRSAGELKIGVHMLNSGGKKLYVKDMSVLSKMEASLDFKQVLLRPEAKNFTQVASLACSGALPGNSRRCSTHISLQILDNHTHNTFTYRALGWDVSAVLQVRQKGTDQVDLWLTNPLPVSLTVTNASLSHRAQGLLKVVNFSGVLTVPQGCWRVLSLRVLNKTLPVSLLSTLRLDTSLGTALHLPLHLTSSVDKQGEVLLEVKGQCSKLCPLRMSETGMIQWHRSLLPDSSSSSWAVDSKLAAELCSPWHSHREALSSWAVDSKLAAELCSPWHSHKEQLPCRWPRLPVDPDQPLDFGATPLNESKVKRLTLKNPTSSVVSLEIRALSQYPAQLEALDLLTKWFNISPLSVNITTTEFSLLTTLPTSLDGVQGVKGSGVLRLTLQPWESREVGVMFTPSEHKHTTTILIVRNNLTVFDMVTVRGHGAKELLRVGGKLPGPGASLRFNVPQSTLMECRDGVRTNKPLFAIRKSFKVENAGELPLTVMSMNINGYSCQGFGFEVLQCHPFSLDHNSSSEITIAFTPDFTSSWVIRDLTLVTSRGSSFPFTLNVTLPHHMLPLCAQVVPGPSWEDTFWVFTLIFTCFSLLGVCLMAFHQAQYILTEFSSPGIRINHSNAALSREHNPPVNNITPNGVSKTKGSCKSYVDSGHTSDKGKGRGSPALANSGSAPRSQSSNKKGSSVSGSGSGSGSGSTSSSQPQKKHRVSLFYTKYKPGSSPSSSAVTMTTTAAAEEEEQREDLSPAPPLTPDPDVCNNNEPLFPPAPLHKTTSTTSTHFNPGFKEDSEMQLQLELEPAEDSMFPMEAPAGFPDNVTVGPGPRPGLLLCSPAAQSLSRPDSLTVGPGSRPGPQSLSRPDSLTVGPGSRPGLLLCSPAAHSTERYTDSKTDSAQLETRDDVKPQKKKCESPESGGPTTANKGKKNRRKTAESGVPDHSVLMMSEREKEADWRTGEPQRNANGTRSRNRCSKTEPLKPVQNPTVPLKHNGVCVSRPRRRCPAERGGAGGGAVCESGSDSGSSSGSVRTSRGSWSSTSSMEGERDMRKRDSVQQYNMYPADRECYQTINTNYKTQSAGCLYRKDVCQTPEPPVPCFNPSFAAVTAGLDRSADLSVQCFPGEMTSWSAPLTTEFRYNTTECPPAYLPQPAAPGPYNRFPWSTTSPSSSSSTGNSSQCNTSYSPCEPGSYMTGNGDLQGGFTCPDGPSAYSPQASWGDDSPPDPPSAWETTPCMGSKPYVYGTRSLSPMSSLFGSIWTPQSQPYQSHAFHHAHSDRSAPISPVSPVAPPYSSSSGSASVASPFGGSSSSVVGSSREPLSGAPSCPVQVQQQQQQQKLQYSSFNPFGPHMNLDIWNSSSSLSSARSSNSQLSSDSGYCGDV